MPIKRCQRLPRLLAEPAAARKYGRVGSMPVVALCTVTVVSLEAGHKHLQFHWGDVIMPHAELLKTKGDLDASGAATPVTVVAHGLAVLPPDEVALVSADAEGFHLRGSVRFHKIQLRPQ